MSVATAILQIDEKYKLYLITHESLKHKSFIQAKCRRS